MDILNLSRLKIYGILESEHDLQIQVEITSPPSSCPHCGCVANLYKHSSREQICMDLPARGKRVGLCIRRQRYRCRECNQTFWERIDDIIDDKRNCTKRLLAYIEKQSLKREIFAYFDHRITNAYTESLNSLIRVTNRLGRGYSFEALRAKILFTKGLIKQRKPKHQRRLDGYELREENFPMFKVPLIYVRDQEERKYLGIDLPALIEKLEKGQ